ncbi:WXG100 family type VII secretion target [Micromonospora marina]|uniref:WXG100 family type VII secretion target n=1 Tax=Micromonospora marina TaxID=307120 RepID=UPI003453741A
MSETSRPDVVGKDLRMAEVDHWGWKEIKAAIYGYAAGVGTDAVKADAAKISDPETFRDAALKFRLARDVISDVARVMEQQADAVAGKNGPWRGEAAEQFRRAVRRYAQVLDAHVRHLDGGRLGDRSVVDGLMAAGNQLLKARQQVAEIDVWYSDQALKLGAGKTKDGLTIVSSRPEVVTLLTKDMRKVLDSLKNTYTVTYADFTPPPPDTFTRPGSGFSGASPGPRADPTAPGGPLGSDSAFDGWTGNGAIDPWPGGNEPTPQPFPSDATPPQPGPVEPWRPGPVEPWRPDLGDVLPAPGRTPEHDPATALAGVPKSFPGLGAPGGTSWPGAGGLGGGGLGGDGLTGTGFGGAGLGGGAGTGPLGMTGLHGTGPGGGASGSRTFGASRLDAGALGTGMTGYGAPLGGMGAAGTGQSEERERTTWLVEDADVWGADPDLPPDVVGR